METGHENLVDVLYNSARYSTMPKGKNMSNVLANVSSFLGLNIQTHTEQGSIKCKPFFFFFRIWSPKGGQGCRHSQRRPWKLGTRIL